VLHVTSGAGVLQEQPRGKGEQLAALEDALEA